MQRPGKIMCVGRNYREHAKEMGNEVPTTPLVFIKPASSVVASGDAIVLPAGIGRVDFEGEIGLVIGRRLKKATPAECAAAVRGVVAVNDVSARDLQKSDPAVVARQGAGHLLSHRAVEGGNAGFRRARDDHASKRSGASAGTQ
jgi:2-keto-4-pentenoate hydratase/2-oxohepta-3-ene-1,7-dioic acid hydratase in catechol pathway